MNLREQFHRHRKDNRFILGVLGGALLFFTVVYYLILQGRELPPHMVTNQVLLFVLQGANVVLIFACLFVLFRTLIKLWVEHRNHVLGAKFRTKLVVTNIVLSLLPVLLLFAYASELIQGSIENLFRSPVGEILEYGDDVAQELTARIQAFNQRAAERVIQRIAPIDLQDPNARGDLGEILKRSLGDENLDMLLVFEETEFVHAVVNPEAGQVALPDAGSPFLLAAIREGNARKVLESTTQEQRILLAAASLQRDEAPITVVVAGTVLDPTLSSRHETLVEAYQDYLQLQVQKPNLQTTYILIFLMITLVILLTSVWVAVYLAGRVTTPIQALADGTRQIMDGDLSHRVDVEAGDELGVLVESFNRMTTELGANKALLERQNLELTGINRSLDEERRRIRAVLRNVAAGVLSVDRDGEVLTCNEAALEMLHQNEEEVLGQSLESIWSDDQRRKLLAPFEYDPLGRDRRQVQLRLGGTWKTIEVKVSTMFDGAGAITGHVLVLEDLSELIQAQQLATWNEAARRIAHEIKNPLTPIKLAAERLLKRHQAHEGVDEDLEAGVATIVREVETMKQMVDEFSRFARMRQPHPVEVDLNDLFGDTLQLYKDIKPGLELSYSVDPGSPTARFDKEQMRGVLINLLDNAVEATEAPGSINLKASPSNGSISLTVEDSGPGIPEDAKAKLFQPYFSTKGRGTGLGLSIVFRVVHDHHGSIQVEDNKPTGTIFRIELPQ